MKKLQLLLVSVAVWPIILAMLSIGMPAVSVRVPNECRAMW